MTGTAEGLTLRQLGPSVYLPSAVYSTGLGAVAPVIVLSAIDLGVSPAAAAVVAALLGLGQIAGALPAGVLIARVGERRTMLAATSLALPALLICILARDVFVFGAAVALLGLTGAAWGVARHAYLTEAVRPDLRARAMSTLGGLGRVGTFAGPFLGSAAIHVLGLDGAYIVALTLVGLATALVAFLPPVPHDRPAPAGAAQPALWAVIRDNAAYAVHAGLRGAARGSDAGVAADDPAALGCCARRRRGHDRPGLRVLRRGGHAVVLPGRAADGPAWPPVGRRTGDDSAGPGACAVAADRWPGRPDAGRIADGRGQRAQRRSCADRGCGRLARGGPRPVPRRLAGLRGCGHAAAVQC